LCCGLNQIFSDTAVALKLELLVTNTNLLKGVEKLSTGEQTAAIEACHSLVIQFAAKNVVYGFAAMEARSVLTMNTHCPNNIRIFSRLQLTALHYNSNAERGQAKTKDGKDRWTVYYPKFKKGGYSVWRVKEGAIFGE
jgi:hypothetical protein